MRNSLEDLPPSLPLLESFVSVAESKEMKRYCGVV